MSGSSRSRVLKAIGGAATVVVAFALIGAGVQLARNAEGYEVQTAALEEIDGAPATVLDDQGESVAPRPPVIPAAEAAVPPAPPSETTPPPSDGSNDGNSGGDDEGGGSDDPTDPEVPPELEPIIGLVDDVAGATSETLGATTESDETLIDSTVDATTETLDDTTSSLGL